MPVKLPSHLKAIVIQQWLEEKSRDTIASDNDVSAGAVTNIVEQWKKGIGQYIADDLRELAIVLKKANITPIRCATGLRRLTIMNNLGVKEEDVGSFIINVYNRSNEKGLPTNKIADYIEEFLSFSNPIASFTEIPIYLQEKKEEKANLEQDIQSLKEQIRLLSEEKLTLEIQRERAYENQSYCK